MDIQISPHVHRRNFPAQNKMASIDYIKLSAKVCDALRATFTDLISANSDQFFYTFAIWTDDSLQFATAAANTEEGLLATVEQYKADADLNYDTTVTRNSMRWAYGDWQFFPVDDINGHLSEVNAILQDNFNAEESIFNKQIGPLTQALLDGFIELEKDRFFGTGDERSRITLLLVGDLPDETVNSCAAALNPPDFAERFLNWNYDATDN